MQPLHGFETRGLWACRLWVDLGKLVKAIVNSWPRSWGRFDLPKMILALFLRNSLLTKIYVATNWM